MLWISLIVGSAAAVAIALSILERERRSFFINGSWAQPRSQPRGQDSFADRFADRHEPLRHSTLPRVGEILADIASGRDAGSQAGPPISLLASSGLARLSKIVADRFSRRHPPEEHATQAILRAMLAARAAAAPASASIDDLPTASAEPAVLPPDTVEAGQPRVDADGPAAAIPLEGIVHVERGGQLRFADPIARDLLHWNTGDLTLSDLLAGGSQEATALMEAVGRQEIVEQTLLVRTDASSQQLHVTAVASRGRDGSLWGTLLILRRP